MSAFAALRMWGASVPIAYAVQGLFVLAAMAAVSWLAWRRERVELRNALVCAAVVVSTPYVLDYDLVVLLPALAWLWLDGRERDFGDWDATIMAVVWMIPLVGRAAAQHALIPLGLMSALAVALIALRRVRASPSRHSHEAFAR